VRSALRRDPGDIPARVILWDELAPPSPLPIPVDAARSNAANDLTR